jgi:hypothetical protein
MMELFRSAVLPYVLYRLRVKTKLSGRYSRDVKVWYDGTISWRRLLGASGRLVDAAAGL